MNNKIIFSVLVLSTGLVIMVNIIGFSQVSGFFHDPKPEPPNLRIDVPPYMQEELDKLYLKHPHITQYDIDSTFDIMSTKCADESDNESYSAAMFVCTAISSATLNAYLETWGYTLLEKTPVMKAPQLAQ